MATLTCEVGVAQFKDPVCGMVIDEGDAVGTSDYKGTRYYFCSDDCKIEFDESPQDYAAGADGASGGATRPM